MSGRFIKVLLGFDGPNLSAVKETIYTNDDFPHGMTLDGKLGGKLVQRQIYDVYAMDPDDGKPGTIQTSQSSWMTSVDKDARSDKEIHSFSSASHV